MILHKLLFSVILLIIPMVSFGQASADYLRSTGKIYSVVLAVVILFLGIVLYVWRLDKKVRQMEDDFQK